VDKVEREDALHKLRGVAQALAMAQEAIGKAISELDELFKEE